MAAFTVNSLTSKGPWLVIDAYSADVSTSTAILADVAGNSHLVRSIAIDSTKGSDDKWIKVFDGTDLQLGPIKTGTDTWSQTFVDGITFEEGVYIQTEADAQTHVTIEYQIVPGP